MSVVNQITCVYYTRRILTDKPNAIVDLLLDFVGIFTPEDNIGNFPDNGILHIVGLHDPRDGLHTHATSTENRLEFSSDYNPNEIVIVNDVFRYLPCNCEEKSGVYEFVSETGFWKLQDIVDCILVAETMYRPHSDNGWNGEPDYSHRFFEGLEEFNGIYTCNWGS